jgi:hypothetical protein
MIINASLKTQNRKDQNTDLPLNPPWERIGAQQMSDFSDSEPRLSNVCSWQQRPANCGMAFVWTYPSRWFNL